jgi:hypothetical protein
MMTTAKSRHWRAVKARAGQGVRPFIDVATGSPDSPSIRWSPPGPTPAQVAYVDNDPVVLCHTQACWRPGPASRSSPATRVIRALPCATPC